MSQNNIYRTNSRYYDYQEGSTARRYAAREEAPYYEQPSRNTDTRRRAAKAPAVHAHPAALVLMLISFVVFANVIIGYVQLRADLVSTSKSVTALQRELSDLRSLNDEALAQVGASIDLNEIESVARGELGMKYASEGQIITYSAASNDYMRRVADGE